MLTKWNPKVFCVNLHSYTGKLTFGMNIAFLARQLLVKFALKMYMHNFLFVFLANWCCCSGLISNLKTELNWSNISPNNSLEGNILWQIGIYIIYILEEGPIL